MLEQVKNIEPEKWRDCIDPFALPLKKIKIKEVLGYPYAANQVFYFRSEENGKEGYYYLKYAAHKDANIKNEAETLEKLKDLPLPEVVEYDEENFRYEVTRQIEGERLSVILARENSEDALRYMFTYGKTLAVLHVQKGNFPKAPERVFHTLPDLDYLKTQGIERIYQYLKENFPKKTNECFVHGDFHYANILWKNGDLAGILDFELAGMGNREYDIAWAIILRPDQKFMKTEEERELFLQGYNSVSPCNKALVRYYMALIYSRFIKLGGEEYRAYVKDWLDKNVP